MSLDFFLYHYFFLIWMLLSTWKSGSACFVQMFFFIENNIGIYCSVQFHTNILTWSIHSGKKKNKKKKLENKNNVNLAIKKLMPLKWVCVNAVNNSFNWQHYSIVNMCCFLWAVLACSWRGGYRKLTSTWPGCPSWRPRCASSRPGSRCQSLGSSITLLGMVHLFTVDVYNL